MSTQTHTCTNTRTQRQTHRGARAHTLAQGEKTVTRFFSLHIGCRCQRAGVTARVETSRCKWSWQQTPDQKTSAINDVKSSGSGREIYTAACASACARDLVEKRREKSFAFLHFYFVGCSLSTGTHQTLALTRVRWPRSLQTVTPRCCCCCCCSGLVAVPVMAGDFKNLLTGIVEAEVKD